MISHPKNFQDQFSHLKQLIAPYSFKKIMAVLSIGIILLGSVTYGIYSHFHVSTDDAYVNANIVQISPQVTGQVAHLYVTNNQFVNQGQVLFELDQEPFIVAVKQAKAQLAIDEAKLKLAQVTEYRTQELLRKKLTSPQEGDSAKAVRESTFAAVELDKASLARAELNLRYTKVSAITRGYVTNMSLREGNIVTANQPLFALVNNNEFWIDANFKETELRYIYPGQKVDISVDMYSGHLFKGVVESISGGSGTVFSLLPPENATGNWVKVTQRVPVRIQILNLDPKFPLRIGTSAIVTVHL